MDIRIVSAFTDEMKKYPDLVKQVVGGTLGVVRDRCPKSQG